MTIYEVALSFAGEHRDYVDRVAQYLQSRGVKVFYDKFEQSNLWGKDGVEEFQRIFSSDTLFVVMFISKEYTDKPWTTVEKRAAIAKAISQRKVYILPVRFDDSTVPGIPSTTIYLMASDFSPEQLAAEICNKIGISGDIKASQVAPPHMTSISGEVIFDYSSHNGRYLIGDDTTSFETMWAKAGDTAIHICNDPINIEGVAIARGANEIADVIDASKFDFSSRCQTPQVGEVVILRNMNQFYAAIKIISIKDRTRQDDNDEVHFTYRINIDRSPNFSFQVMQR